MCGMWRIHAAALGRAVSFALCFSCAENYLELHPQEFTQMLLGWLKLPMAMAPWL